MCLWQRWPHVAAALIGLFALALGRWSHGRFMPWLGMLAALVIGRDRRLSYRGRARLVAGTDLLLVRRLAPAGDLLRLEGPLGIVMCDEVAWQMLGLSMASWNMLASLGLAVIWAMAARR